MNKCLKHPDTSKVIFTIGERQSVYCMHCLMDLLDSKLGNLFEKDKYPHGSGTDSTIEVRR
jgi:hypothetical protein